MIIVHLVLSLIHRPLSSCEVICHETIHGLTVKQNKSCYWKKHLNRNCNDLQWSNFSYTCVYKYIYIYIYIICDLMLKVKSIFHYVSVGCIGANIKSLTFCIENNSIYFSTNITI